MTPEQRDQPQWETIVAAASDEHAVTDRLPVPGGWLYRVMNRVSGVPSPVLCPRQGRTARRKPGDDQATVKPTSTVSRTNPGRAPRDDPNATT
jgi:hypothetical protein